MTTIYSSNNGNDFRREPDDADVAELERAGRTVHVIRAYKGIGSAG